MGPEAGLYSHPLSLVFLAGCEKPDPQGPVCRGCKVARYCDAECMRRDRQRHSRRPAMSKATVMPDDKQVVVPGFMNNTSASECFLMQKEEYHRRQGAFTQGGKIGRKVPQSFCECISECLRIAGKSL